MVRQLYYYPTEDEVRRAGSGFRWSTGNADKRPLTVREFLNELTSTLDLTWSYDATRDAVVLDYTWHVSDGRSTAELMDTLGKTTPPEDKKHIFSSTVDQKSDPWRVAFNALLSSPENYAGAGQTRWKADVINSSWLKIQPINILTGKILDETGAVRFLIVNIQDGEPVTPSDSMICFYLFSASGKFEHGGLFESEDRYGFTRAEVAADQKRLVVHNGPPSYNQLDQVFAVEKDRLVFKDHLLNGKSTPPFNPFKYSFEVCAY